MSYEGSDDEEELVMSQTVSENNNNNNNIISDFDSYSDDKNEENVFVKDIDKEVEATPKAIIGTKVVHAMKKLQASYNNDANRIIKQAT